MTSALRISVDELSDADVALLVAIGRPLGLRAQRVGGPWVDIIRDPDAPPLSAAFLAALAALAAALTEHRRQRAMDVGRLAAMYDGGSDSRSKP
jgi:hypothetical protein